MYHYYDILLWYIHLRWIFNDINHPASLGYPHDLGNIHITISGWWFKTWLLWLSIQLGIVTPSDEVIFIEGFKPPTRPLLLLLLFIYYYYYIYNIHRILHRVIHLYVAIYRTHIYVYIHIYTYNTCRIQQNTFGKLFHGSSPLWLLVAGLSPISKQTKLLVWRFHNSSKYVLCHHVSSLENRSFKT